MKKYYLYYLIFFCFISLGGLYFYTANVSEQSTYSVKTKEEIWSTKKTKVKSGKEAYMKPDGFIEYYNSVSKRVDQKTSDYANGYRFKELSKSIKKSAQARKSSLNAEFKSRGPGNVGGRTRAIAIDPDDATNCTWIAGAASGGLWKTTDCGDSWVNISPDLPNLSTNSIAQAVSNPDVIYVGTGEVFAGNTTFVRGEGIYKSTDRGENWALLPSTTDSDVFQSVNRIQVDPTNENILVIATNKGVLKSSDGGDSWNIQYESPAGIGATYRAVQDLQVDPNDFSVQYAGVNGLGIIKSNDAGETWDISSDGISEGIRFEVAVSPSDPNIVYTSTYSGSTTFLYFSEDKGENWVLANDPNYNTDFLGGQGWYDNTVAVNPYNPYEVFVGGVSIGKYEVDPNDVSESDRDFIGVEVESSVLFDFVSFNDQLANGGTLDIGSGNNSPSEDPVTVEIRFGGDNSQMAHRFTVPEGETSGVPIANYAYQDFVEVPFEIWDIENNRQLAFSFRDQENDGVFNLNKRSDSDSDLSNAREYFYIHDVTYEESPNENIAQDGAVEYANMYYFWPVLNENAEWDSNNLQESTVRLKYGSTLTAAAKAVAVYDAYGSYEGQNQNNLHPDHHHLTMIKMNDASETFMIVNGNDGGLGISSNSGGVIDQITDGYVTTQFYGADKKPGEEKYIGGTQDNGTWVSSGTTVDETNAYNFVIGGDGFEVLWHPIDTDLVLGSIYNNQIRKSTNGGQSFSPSASGITSNDGPFITRLAGSVDSPNTVYAIGAEGVYKSTDFGSTWTMKTIDQTGWGGNASASDVEVSKANSDIVWAGAGMIDTNTKYNFFVSTDAGETYTAVNNYSPLPNTSSTGIYTHPTDENTAYALFSRANFPKILKTTDLGQSWEDISGFEGNNGVSDRGFPDVFVHSLLVMPFDTDIIWAGTEIGLYESLDGGLSWNIRNDIPAVSIWSMKIVDDEVVLGTHGRGIWTATIEDLAEYTLTVASFDYLGFGEGEISLNLPVSYDQVKVLINGEETALVDNPQEGEIDVPITDFNQFSGAEIQIIGVIQGNEFPSNKFPIEAINVAPEILNFETSKEGAVYPVTIELENNEFFDRVEVLFDDQLVHTDQQNLTRNDAKRIIQFDYEDQGEFQLKIKAFLNGSEFVSLANLNVVTSNIRSEDNAIKVYPNPTASYLNISSNTIAVDVIKIYNSKGVQVNKIDVNTNAKNTQLDLSLLNQGVYLIQIVGQDGKMLTKRIIKE